MEIRSKIFFIIWFSMVLTTLSAEKSGNDSDNYQNPDTSRNNQYLRINPFNVTILPPSSGVQFYRDGIIFLSSSKFENDVLTDHISFGTIDTYYAQLKDSVINNQIIFSPNASFPFPTDAVDFSNDFNTMYFTQFSQKDGAEKIYRANYVTGQGKKDAWILNSTYESFCTDKASYTHPALSKDGRLMIFSSNKKESLGGMDLFITRNINGVWSIPENLGNILNTINHELYPYLDSDNNLYYSSNGLSGLGGYDIFVCRFNNGKWDKPVNLAQPVNTQFDDVAFKINRSDQKTAFYTVMRGTRRRVEQLFQVRMVDNASLKNMTALSQLFIGPEQKADKSADPVIVAANTPEIVVKDASPKAQPATVEPVAKKSETKTGISQKTQPVTVKPAAKKSETKVDISQKAQPAIVEPAKKSETKTDISQKVQPPVSEASEKQPVVIPVETTEKKDEVVYRVQISSNVKSKGSYQIKIKDKDYSTYEYLYKGAYRTCVGEFSSLSSVTEFQSICRESGYPQAFVVAFINNERSIDPALFKKSTSR